MQLSDGRLLPGRGEERIEPDTTVLFESPGGGGFGLPGKRAPHAIAADLLRGLISAERALKDYGLKDDSP